MPVLEPSAAEAIRITLQAQLDVPAASERGVREGVDPEELHRFRVALRRSRSLLRAARPVLEGQLAGVDAELRWLGSVTGPPRDLDVLTAHCSTVSATTGPGERH